MIRMLLFIIIVLIYGSSLADTPRWQQIDSEGEIFIDLNYRTSYGAIPNHLTVELIVFIDDNPKTPRNFPGKTHYVQFDCTDKTMREVQPYLSGWKRIYSGTFAASIMDTICK